MFMGMASVPVVASRSEVSDDSMNYRCLSMRFYDIDRGFYEIETRFYDIDRGFYEIEPSL